MRSFGGCACANVAATDKVTVKSKQRTNLLITIVCRRLFTKETLNLLIAAIGHDELPAFANQ